MTFKKLAKFAKKIGWNVQKNTDRFARFELFSTKFAPGTTIVCSTVKELQNELADVWQEGNCLQQ